MLADGCFGDACRPLEQVQLVARELPRRGPASGEQLVRDRGEDRVDEAAPGRAAARLETAHRLAGDLRSGDELEVVLVLEEVPERRPIAEIDVEVLLQDPPRALARDGLVIEQRDTLLHAVGDSRQVTQRRFEALEDVADLAFAAAHVAGGNVTGRPGDQEQRASEIGYGVEEVDAPVAVVPGVEP